MNWTKTRWHRKCSSRKDQLLIFRSRLGLPWLRIWNPIHMPYLYMRTSAHTVDVLMSNAIVCTSTSWSIISDPANSYVYVSEAQTTHICIGTGFFWKTAGFFCKTQDFLQIHRNKLESSKVHPIRRRVRRTETYPILETFIFLITTRRFGGVGAPEVREKSA